MRMEQLRCLVDVLQTKSMSKTAERLFISPQAVSKSIKQLEQELGVELLVRNSSGVAPTKVGVSIAELAENMLAEEQQMNQIIVESKRREERHAPYTLRIGSTSTVINIVLPSILPKLKRTGVDIEPRIITLNSMKELLEQVKQGHCDIGLLTYNEQELIRLFAAYQDSLNMDLLARDEIVVVMDRSIYREGQEYLSSEEYQEHFRTIYGLLPVEDMMQPSREVHVMCSNDAEFHRMMMKKADAYVLMSGLAYQYFFSSKSYAALPMEAAEAPLLHAAVYRKGAADLQHYLAAMIRTEMQMR